MQDEVMTEHLNRLEDFIGQSQLKAALRKRIENAHLVGVALPHLLFGAASEMGKKTLASLVANEMGVPFTVRPCDGLSVTDLTGVFSNIRARQVLALEDLDCLHPSVRDLLTQTIENFRVSIKVGTGPSARVHDLPMPHFTLIGLTSRLPRVESSLRRWCVPYEFEPYTAGEIEQVLLRVAARHGVRMDAEAAREFVPHCGGSPGDAAVMVQRIARIVAGYGGRLSPDGPEAIDIRSAPLLLAELGYDAHFPMGLRLQDSLNAMDGIEFERWVAELFRGQEYGVKFTETTGDHGIDLLLTKDGQTTAVQCKRWSGAVGEPILRDFYGSISSAGVASGIVVTTSVFTASARAFAEKTAIRLIDMEDLTHLFQATQITAKKRQLGLF